jgi:predicted nucleic acid-binding protein
MTADDRAFLLDTLTAHTLLLADAPDVLRDRVRAARFGSLWMSAVTEGELRHRFGETAPLAPRREALELLFRNVPTVPFDRSAALAYARLRQHPAVPKTASELELLVAAHAISVGATLITPDTGYAAIGELSTANWHIA